MVAIRGTTVLETEVPPFAHLRKPPFAAAPARKKKLTRARPLAHSLLSYDRSAARNGTIGRECGLPT